MKVLCTEFSHTTTPDSSENLYRQKRKEDLKEQRKVTILVIILHRACTFLRRSSEECITETSNKLSTILSETVRFKHNENYVKVIQNERVSRNQD